LQLRFGAEVRLAQTGQRLTSAECTYTRRWLQPKSLMQRKKLPLR
jgi:hypothetical protein